MAAVSGIVDADAVTLSMARPGGSGLDLNTAGQAIMIGVAVNTLAKATMAIAIGGRSLGPTVIAASVAALAAGFAVTLVPF